MKNIKMNKKLIAILKAILCIATLLSYFIIAFDGRLESYHSYKDYSYQNNDKQTVALSEEKEVKQAFTAKGNIIDNLSVYYGDTNARQLRVSIQTIEGKEITGKDINTDSLTLNAWNTLGITTSKLKRNAEYFISISSDEGLDGIFIGTSSSPKIFKECFTSNGIVSGKLLTGINFTYCYITLASIFEILVKAIVTCFYALMLCLAIINFEKVLSAFKIGNKHGIAYALFFSLSTVLLYNPVSSDNTRVLDFNRIIGAGLVSDVDVSRRTSNFNYWFIAFGITFLLYFMLANYLLKKEKSKECTNLLNFLDSFIVLGNCGLILRCITFFKDSQNTENIFYFSQNIIAIIVIISISYMLLRMDRYISSDLFESLAVLIFSVSIVLTIFYGRDLGNGRLLIGVIVSLFVIVFILCRHGKISSVMTSVESQIKLSTVVASCIPLSTSLYIELIHVLNQHNIFVAHPAKYYKIACILGFIGYFIILLVANRKRFFIKQWKNLSFPLLIVGISCLSVQIPLSTVYNPDLFEGANASILMSDFLNFGDVPIVQHYGGHMMTSVWEGILYAILNNDYAGIVSPYSSLISPLLVLLFYFVISKVWNREMALTIALLFPFLGSFSYYGLGVMICLSAMAYVRKRTWQRAATLWATFIWCAIYRLDLGFAFGLAVIIALIIYTIANHDKTSIRQLGLTLIAWGLVGGTIWLTVCFAKGINPISRLFEFLLMSMSNRNWAYSNIGNVNNTLFAWGYIIIPLIMVSTLLYTVFSKAFREKIGTEKWILLLILNLSYFENFSRGLVRHSLAETSTTIVFWSAYLFIALFIGLYRNNMKVFVPSFMTLILLNTLFVSAANFNSLPIVDSAVSSPQPIIQSWKPTRFYDEETPIIAKGGVKLNTTWEKLQYEENRVNRVVLADSLTDYASKYTYVLDRILENNETFVDFINKTLLYSVIGRQCPVYVSQSPLQLSGEFTQKEFIKEIDNVPVVLMPIDSDNNRASNALDGITNAYRYYKVYEYICQNYRPLCRYGNYYTVWCLSDRFDDYLQKLNEISGVSKNYTSSLIGSETIGKGHVELIQNEADSVTITYTGKDPMITELQTIIDTSAYIGNIMRVSIDYKSDTPGTMQLFYTTEKDEGYVGNKVVSSQINEEGTAIFDVPITQYSRLRLDTPEESTVVIRKLVTSSIVEPIDYGYDGPIETIDASGNASYGYISSLHNTSIAHLPRIWAEEDGKNSINNSVVFTPSKVNEIYVFDSDLIPKENGNYIKLSTTYDGTDTQGKYKPDDEFISATVILGFYDNDTFKEKSRYSFTISEGQHDYLIRCSTDYYWYCEQVNAIKISTSANLRNTSVQILGGD